jgi:hypothetical protein
MRVVERGALRRGGHAKIKNIVAVGQGAASSQQNESVAVLALMPPMSMSAFGT